MSLPEDPALSIIVVNFKRLDLTRDCLASLEAQSRQDIEVLVVDNGSGPEDAAYVASLSGIFRGICLPENSGFTGGNLAAYPYCRGRYIALLNNDAVADRDWAAELILGLDADPTAGFAASMILRLGQDEVIDSAGDGMTTAGRGFKRGEMESSRGYREATAVFGACAAASAYRRSALDEVGFLDDLFYFNCEDTDLGLRLRLADWHCRYLPKAKVWHHVSASHSLLGWRATYYWSRNVELAWLKNWPLALLLRYLPVHVFQEAATILRNLLRPKMLFALIAGKLAVIPLLPALWFKRQSSQRFHRINSQQFASFLVPAFSYELITIRMRRLLAAARS